MNKKMFSLFVIFVITLVLFGCRNHNLNNNTIDKDLITNNNVINDSDIVENEEIDVEESNLNKINNLQKNSYVVGETIRFGGYDWIVLDVRNDKALLLTKDIIAFKHANIIEEAESALRELENIKMKFWSISDFKDYDIFDSKYKGIFEKYSEYELEHPEIVGDNMRLFSWEQSSLRTWLNNELDFTPDEWTMIEETEVIDELGAGENTVDKVFILDKNQVNKYFPRNEERGATSIAPDEDILFFLKRSLLTGDLSGYLAKKAIGTRTGGTFYWWVRSTEPTKYGSVIPLVAMSTDDDVASIAPMFSGPLGVRPAIWIEITN